MTCALRSRPIADQGGQLQWQAIENPRREPRVNTDRVLGSLKGVVQTTPHTWKAQCPAHEDANPSLSVTEQPGRLLLHCHAGCSFEAVLGAAGIDPADCRDQKVKERALVVATYDYFDERGGFLFQVCRCEDKRFFQRRLDEFGQWVNNLSGVTRTLYRLPELTQAKGSRVVFIVEGEKDVDRLYALGFLATTNPGGAGKWKPAFSEALKDRHIVVVPDNDKIGKEHSAVVVEALSKSAASIRVLDLPDQKPHGDISNWLDKDHTAQELKELITATPPVGETKAPEVATITATDLLRMSLPPVRFLVPGILPEGLALLVGRPKVGKSWLCLDLAIAVAGGGMALGKIQVEAREVLYLAMEDNLRRLQARLKTLLLMDPPPIGLHFKLEWPRLDPQSGGLAQLSSWIRQHPAAGLVIIDTLARVKPAAERGGQAYDLDTTALAGLQSLAGQNGMTIVCVHHSRKALAEDPLDAVSGTLALTGVADTTLILKRASTRASGELFIVGRDVDQQDLALGWGDEFPSWTLLGKAEEFHLSQDRQKVKELLRESPGPLSPKDISEALDIDRNIVHKLLARMVAAADIRKIDRGKYVDQDGGPTVETQEPLF